MLFSSKIQAMKSGRASPNFWRPLSVSLSRMRSPIFLRRASTSSSHKLIKHRWQQSQSLSQLRSDSSNTSSERCLTQRWETIGVVMKNTSTSWLTSLSQATRSPDSWLKSNRRSTECSNLSWTSNHPSTNRIFRKWAVQLQVVCSHQWDNHWTCWATWLGQRSHLELQPWASTLPLVCSKTQSATSLFQLQRFTSYSEASVSLSYLPDVQIPKTKMLWKRSQE